MYLHSLEVKLNPRTKVKPYNAKLNPATLEILALIFEFKLASAWQISRFLKQEDNSRHIYAKLRRMWQAGLLESFKIFSTSTVGVSLYYILSKQGLNVLKHYGKYEVTWLRTYPKIKNLLSPILFRHEAQIVEMASLESLNRSKNLSVSFKGEVSSKYLGFRDDKHIEILTPDYIVIYKTENFEQSIYTEFERTWKSKATGLTKIQRYLDFIPQADRQKYILRLIFQNPNLEKAFWLNIFINRPALLKLKIITTNLELISKPIDFLQQIYATEATVKLTKYGRLTANITTRIKLFN